MLNEKRENRFAYLVNAPMMVYLCCVLVFPMIWGLYMSFTNKTIGNPAEFIGFSNYIKLLGDPEYRRSILNTIFQPASQTQKPDGHEAPSYFL